jgi:hypothetical protein
LAVRECALSSVTVVAPHECALCRKLYILRKEERGEIAVGDRKSTTESTRSCAMLRVGSKDLSHFFIFILHRSAYHITTTNNDTDDGCDDAVQETETMDTEE